MSSRGRNHRVKDALALGFFGLCAVLPVGGSVGYAAAYSVGLAGLLSQGFTLQHWRAVLAAPETAMSFVVSFYVALVTLALTAAFSLLFTLTLRQSVARGRWGISSISRWPSRAR